MTILVVPLFIIFFTSSKRDEYYKKVLKENGINVSAFVIGFEKERHRGSTSNFTTISYTINNKVIIQRIDGFHDYKKNQKLELIVSKNIPEIFKIIEPKK